VPVPVTISAVAANICCLPIRPQAAVRQRVIQALDLGVAVFFAEIEIPRYSRAVRVQSAKRARRVFGLGHEVPISVPSSYLVTSAEVVRVHGGLARVSPSRVMTIVKADVQGEKVAFIACHPVSKPRLGVSHARWRISRWNTYKAALRRQIAILHVAGYTVVFGGDMNKTRPGVFHASQVQLAKSGLDHVWVVPGPGKTVTVRRPRVVKRTRLMDHPLVVGTFDLD
jgi:hypothetical protein